MLTDIEFVNKVKQNINEVITEYEYDSDMDLENPDKTFLIDSHLLWETIKMKIRGTAMVEVELKILREEQIKGIITRAKAKWQVEGERNTRFFVI